MEQNGRQVHSLILTIGLVGLIMSLLSACGSPGYEPPPTHTPGPPEIWLDWPVEGEYPPEPLEVLAHVHDPSGQGVDQVELRIDGEAVAAPALSHKPVFDRVVQRWPVEGTPAPRQYLVEVFAVRQGQYSEPASAWITIAEQRPQIELAVDKSAINLSECVTLSWTVVNALQVQLAIDNRVLAEQTPGSNETIQGQYTDCPEQPTAVYRLVAIPYAGEPEQQQVTVEVWPTPQPPPGVEVSFEYDDSAYRAYGDCITLFWEVKNAQSVQLDRIDQIKPVGLNGSEEVCPKDPTNTYRLLVTSLGDEPFERLLTFLVPSTPTPIPPTPTYTPTPTFTPSPTITPNPTTPVPPPPPQPLPQASYWLSGDRTEVNQGEQVRLDWHTSGIAQAFFEGGNISRKGLAGDYGTELDRPTQSTTYILTVHLKDGRIDRRTWTVNVLQEEPLPAVVPAPPPPPQYDLTLTVPPGPLTAEVGKEVSLEITIFNAKGSDLPAFSWRWRKGDGSNWKSESCSAGPQCKKTLQATYTGIECDQMKEYKFEVQLDPNNDIKETNEDNNTKNRTITVNGDPCDDGGLI